MMKRMMCLLLGLVATVVAVADAAPSGTVSDPMAIDIESGVRSEEVVGKLAYDTLWQGVTNADYRILVNGVVLSTGSGAGTVAWHPTKYGTYELAYQAFVDNVKVGEDMSATFVLAGKDLVNAEITLAADEVLYDGTARCPKVAIVYQEEILAEGVDYTLEYEKNIEPGVATMTIQGKGRFSDVLEKNFTIRPAGICSLDIESGTRIASETEPLTYDSSWFGDSTSTYKMYVDGKDLSQGAGVGAYNWVPRAVGGHLLIYRSYSGGYLVSDEYQARFHVNGRDLVHATVSFNDKTILYDGTERKPSITLTLYGKTLVEGVDYSLAYSNNINPGVGIITVTGLGSYVDILDVPFTIRPAGVCFLDIESGTRSVVGPVPLCYDAAWNGDTNATTRMELLSEKDGGAATTISDSLTGVGEYAYSPEKDAAYKVTLNTYVDDVLQPGEKVYTATFNYKAPSRPSYVEVFNLGEHGSWAGGGSIEQTIVAGESAIAPTLAVEEGWRFTGWDRDFYAVNSNMTITAMYEGIPVLRFKLLTCKQRYPWNGKVDVRFELEGVEDGTSYAMTLCASNLTDGMAMPMKTLVYGSASVTDEFVTVSSAHGTVVWDAEADLKDGFESSRVKVYGRISPICATKIVPGYYCAVDLKGGSTASSYPITYLDYRNEANIPTNGWTFADKTRRLIMRRIAPGKVTPRAKDYSAEVAITKPYYISVFETTLGVERMVCGTNMSWLVSPKGIELAYPTQRSFDMIRGDQKGSGWPQSNAVEADSYLGVLRYRTGVAFDLPTESQWEYACRAGTTSDFYNGSDDEASMNRLGRYSGNHHDGKTEFPDAWWAVAVVGEYEPNAWGVYDMHGNAWEWCLDWWGEPFPSSETDPMGPNSGTQRIIKGGNYNFSARDCRSGFYSSAPPQECYWDGGFRVCCPAE